MNVFVENDVKIIEMGDKGPNLLSVERAKQLIKELDYSDCKAVIILGNDKVFSAGLNLKDLSNAKEPKEVALIFNTCLLYTSPSPRDRSVSRMPSSA